MNRFNLSHTTVYRYARPVELGEHRLMFRPRDSHDLRLVDTALDLGMEVAVEIRAEDSDGSGQAVVGCNGSTIRADGSARATGSPSFRQGAPS